MHLDETWANAHNEKEKMRVEDDSRASGDKKEGIRKPSGSGSRLIRVHAGGEIGWVNGAGFVFQSKKATGEYHDETTAQHFEEWLHDMLLPNIQPNSFIVMDNVPYQSRRLEFIPTMN